VHHHTPNEIQSMLCRGPRSNNPYFLPFYLCICNPLPAESLALGHVPNRFSMHADCISNTSVSPSGERPLRLRDGSTVRRQPLRQGRPAAAAPAPHRPGGLRGPRPRDPWVGLEGAPTGALCSLPLIPSPELSNKGPRNFCSGIIASLRKP